MSLFLSLTAISVMTLTLAQEPFAGRGFRAVPLLNSTGTAGPGFVERRGPEVGMDFVNTLSVAKAAENNVYLDGSGVALGDVDGDGHCDIYFCNKEGANALYRNKGNWQFEEVTGRYGLGCDGVMSSGATFADFDGDGLLDLFVSVIGSPNLCFLNRGPDKPFSRQVMDRGIYSRTGSKTIAVADIDGNGTLDVYVANSGEDAILRTGGLIDVATDRDGNPVIRGRYRNRIKFVGNAMVELGEPDSLYLNDGRGGFTSVSWRDGRFLDENGVALRGPARDLSLAAMFRDLNGDREPDLYVCSDFQTTDRIWLNQGHGVFRAAPRRAIRLTSHFSMGVDFADLDRDGLDDFVVVDMLSADHRLRMTQIAPESPTVEATGELEMDRPQLRRNTLFRNRGDGTFSEIAHFAGIPATDWSWAPAFLDVDLDGYEDLLICNGHEFDTQDLDGIDAMKTRPGGRGGGLERLKVFPELRTPNRVFRNRGDLTFEDRSTDWGFQSKEVSHGMAFGDLDNDGDLDVVLNPLNSPPLLYVNRGTAPRLAVRLRGRPPNTRGIGARVIVRGGTVDSQTQEIICGGRYLSGDQAMRVFAVGGTGIDGASPTRITVRWRGGAVSEVTNARPNHRYEIIEPEALPTETGNPGRPDTASATPSSIFIEPPGVIAHEHHETIFDDWALQPTLTRRLSQEGPVAAWLDVDADGDDDLLVGAGVGGTIGVLLNRGGRFEPHPASESFPRARGDVTAIVPWTAANGAPAFLMGQTNYEDSSGKPSRLVVWSFEADGVRESVLDMPDPGVAIGPIAVSVADGDGDGALNLFVGGRCRPGQYPRTAQSWLFRSGPDGLLSELELNPDSERLFIDSGPVAGACWSDLTGDGAAELILACEWDSLRVFEDRNGRLVEVTARRGFSGFTGLWQCVAAADIDGDGLTDLVAGNWGLNSPYQIYNDRAVHLYYGDLLRSGRMDLIEAYEAADPIADSVRVIPIQNRGPLGILLPGLSARYPTHASFRPATMDDILEDAPALIQRRSSRHWASTVFLNRGDRFEPVPLPALAQWTPVFSICPADFDGDGAMDLFLCQNYGTPKPGGEPLNAGLGQLLRGQGDGTFIPVSADASGVKLWGNQRGAAVADYDRDGRMDLVIGQNNGPTRLFRNQGGKPSGN